MDLKKLFDETENHRNFNDAIINNIISYFNGETTFEEMGLSDAHKCGRWYLHPYIKALDEGIEELSKDKEKFKRIIKVFFYLVGNDSLGDMAGRINLNKTIEVYPEFYSEIIEKDKLMHAVFKEEGRWDIKDGIDAIYELFGSKDALDFILNSPKLKSKGHYNASRNLECLIIYGEMEKAFEVKNHDEFRALALRYLSTLAMDYKCTEEYIGSRENILGNRFRKSVSQEEKDALIQLVDTGENWEANISVLKENLKRIRVGNSKREVIAFIEEDDDFGRLFNYLNNIKVKGEELEFINRFKKMILEIAPNYYIEKNFFFNTRSSCAWRNGEKIVSELKKAIEKYPEIEDQLVNYIVIYTLEHYSCKYETHDKAFELLIKNFGTEYILDHLKTRSITDEMDGIYLIDKYGDSQAVAERKQELENIMLDSLLKKIAVDEDSAFALKSYINSEIDEVNTKKLLKKKIEKTGEYGEYHLFKEEKLKRLIKVILESKDKNLLGILPSYFYKGEEKALPHRYMLEEVVALDINTKDFLKIFVDYTADRMDGSRDDKFYYNGNYYNDNILAKGIKYLEDNGVNCLEMGAKFNGKLKKTLLDSLYGTKKAKREVLLLPDFLGEKQKGVVQSALSNLKNLDESVIGKVEDKIYEELEDYKGDKEILAVEVLCHYASDSERLRGIYETVTEPKSRDMIAGVIGLELEDLFKDREGNFDLDAYLDSVYKKSRKFPVELDKISKPVRKDGKDAGRALEQLIISYKNSDELSINKEAVLIAKNFTPESIADFAKSVLVYWKSGKMDMKSKWQLLMPIIHGDYNLIKELANLIEELAANSRQKLAVYLIKALSLNGSKEAFVAIDKIGRRTKFKTLRLASEEAFEIAAKELGISKGELGDQLVGDMGLIDGHVPLDYGSQVVKLFIGNNLKFEIEKEDGKRVKSLPKGSKDDNETLVDEAKEKFKLLKKQLRDMVALQTNRMEDALVEHRLWPAPKWKELFLVNPIMNSIGKGLLWGIYEGESLVQTFAFDTDIFDADYEDVELEDNNKIGIVHPLELGEEKVEAWKEVFADNETEILFGQLDREILEVEDGTALEFKPKDYPRKSPNTLVNRLQKKGWSIGSVRDAGSFDEVYKEIRGANIGIELTVNGCPGMGSYGYEAYDSEDDCVGVEKIEFYRLGKLIRGSYTYDELEEHKGLRYMPNELPKRIVSELLLELKRGLS